MKKLDLKYDLTYNEAYEAFYVLASRRSRRTKVVTGGLLALIAVIMLVMYALNGTGLHYLFLAIISAAMLFYIIYAPVLAARRGARAVERIDGQYHVVLHDDGTIDLPSERGLKIQGDRFARVIETDTVFAMRPDPQHTICIPRRILKEKDENFIRSLMKEESGNK